MQFVDKAPGVYRSDVFLPLESGLPTGVPGFVGFVTRIGDGNRAADNSVLSRPIAMHRRSDFQLSFESWSPGYLADAVNGFFVNEGARCYVAAVELDDSWNSKARAKALTDALDSLAPLTDLDLIAIPDAMTLRSSTDSGKLDEAAVKQVQQYALEHCARNGDRIAILDALPEQNEQALMQQRLGLSEETGPINGALYYPWLKVGLKVESKAVSKIDQQTARFRLVPPSGHVAGVIARSDARAGVFKAPANEEIRDALDVELQVDADTQGRLNSKGVNCLRAFPGRGIRVWGARTLSRDPNWWHLNARRMFLTLERWIELNMTWASFEPNTPELWVRITRELSSYLNDLWKAGALAGQTADEAFYIKCDSETNPPESVGNGQTVTEIGLAPNSPAEFIVVRIVHNIAVEPR